MQIGAFIGIVVLGLVGVLIISLVATNFLTVYQEGLVSLQSHGSVNVSMGLTVDVETLDWGSLDPGANTTRIVQVTSMVNNQQVLSLATSEWNPANATDYLTLTWNYTGESLQAQKTIPIELTLQVSPLTEGITEFSFNVTITSTSL